MVFFFTVGLVMEGSAPKNHLPQSHLTPLWNYQFLPLDLGEWEGVKQRARGMEDWAWGYLLTGGQGIGIYMAKQAIHSCWKLGLEGMMHLDKGSGHKSGPILSPQHSPLKIFLSGFPSVKIWEVQASLPTCQWSCPWSPLFLIFPPPSFSSGCVC